MNSGQRLQIRGLVKRYSVSGTETLVVFVAETDGMLAACQELLSSLDAAGSTSAEWLQRECSKKDVLFHAFIQELTKIVALFQPSHNLEDHHATLEVRADAGLDEIKQAYRMLSRRYHPDTASPPYCNNPEKFIAINKAYHALMSIPTNDQKEQYIQQERPGWRKNVRTVTPEQRKKVFAWTLGLFIILVIISAVASMNYKKRAMLAGLQESRGAFIPPAGKVPEVPTGKDFKVASRSIERPVSPNEVTRTPTQELIVKVQQRPEIDPFNVQVKEPQQKEAGKGVEIPASSVKKKEKLLVEQTYEAQPNRAKERAEVVIAAPSSAPESMVTPTPTPSESVADHSAKKHAGVKSKTQKIDGQVIASTTEVKRTAEAAMVPTGTATQATITEKPQPVPKERAKSIEADVDFNSKVLVQAGNIIKGATEGEVQLTRANVTQVVPLPAEPFFQIDKPKPERPDMQTRVDSFFANYIKAYEQRNLILFSRFFDTDAEENGKPFTTMLPTYLDLFAVADHVFLQVDGITWHLVDGRVAVDGRFKVKLQYKEGRTVNGTGPISFVLVDNNGEFLIKKMQYVFHTE